MSQRPIPGLTLAEVCDLALAVLLEKVDAMTLVQLQAWTVWGSDEEGEADPPPDFEDARNRLRGMLEAPLVAAAVVRTPEDQWTSDLREALGLP